MKNMNFIPVFIFVLGAASSAQARFLSVDPKGFDEKNPMSFNRYSYGNNNPYKFVDPDGKDAVVIIGGQRNDSYNIFGHASGGVTGNGIFSFGTNTKQGSSVTDFVASQSEHRNQYIFTVKTTPAQDEKIAGYLKSQKDDVGYLDNCAVRTYTSLVQGGVAPSDMQAPTPAALMQVMLGLVQDGKASVSVVEKNGKAPDLKEFDKK